MRAQNGLYTLCGHRFAAVGKLSDELQIEYAATLDHVIPRSQAVRRSCATFGVCTFAATSLEVTETVVDVNRSIEHLARLLQNSHPCNK